MNQNNRLCPNYAKRKLIKEQGMSQAITDPAMHVAQ